MSRELRMENGERTGREGALSLFSIHYSPSFVPFVYFVVKERLEVGEGYE
jgi:hypothetical protein